KEYMAALITSEVNNTDKVLAYLNACREMGIEVRQPDINQSVSPFRAQADHIRFGLAGIKNVGQGAIQAIVSEREQNGDYENLLDLCRRANLRKVSKRVLESLIKSGALDVFQCSRAALLAGLDKIVATAQKKKKEKSSGQLSLLSIMEKEEPRPVKPCGLGLDLPEAGLEEWTDEERLKYEKEALGCFISGHPLLRFEEKLKLLQMNTLQQCWELPAETEVRVGLLVTASKEIVTKKGSRMAFCQVEDLTGTGEMTLFPDLYAKIKPQLQFDQPLFCTAKVDADTGEDKNSDNQKKIKLLAQKISLLSEVEIPDDEPYQVDIAERDLREDHLKQFKEILKRFPGKNPVQIRLSLEEGWCRLQLGPEFCVLPVPELKQELSRWQQSLRQQ
ncbi:MAG: DNA polymerase III subunit alpha, partial [Desulfohalobiaceae bacterium]|nr:DNA polymerase III subunit alpha [Desulfohalobiaceae bacterium]